MKRRRKLLASIPADKKTEMKEEIRKCARDKTVHMAQVKKETEKALVDVKNRFAEESIATDREYERKRAAIIERYEVEFGTSAVVEVLT